MTSKIEKRLERLEERMASRLRPRVSDEEIKALMRQEHPESTPDPHDYDDERVAASVGLQRLVEAFGEADGASEMTPHTS